MPALAQINAQKFSIKSFGFQYRSTNTSQNRCLFWYPLSKSFKPLISYTKHGDPYIKVRVRAQMAPDCAIDVSPKDSVRFTPPKPGSNIAYFDVIVRPPVTVVRVDGATFKDELLFDAPTEKFEDINFFSFFRKSKVSFETRYAQLSTNNINFPGYKVPVFPVFGGNIGVPFPWINDLVLGFSMFQNLGNLRSKKSPVQFSEFAFDLRYNFTGKESWGRPTLAPVVDYRGRNIYQTGETSTNRPFVIGSLVLFGAGVDASWYFGGAIAGWDSPFSRIGLDVSTRYYFGGKISGQATAANLIDGALMYRVSKKWAIGGGYSVTTQSATFASATTGGSAIKVTEKISNAFFRLSLIPYLEESKKP